MEKYKKNIAILKQTLYLIICLLILASCSILKPNLNNEEVFCKTFLKKKKADNIAQYYFQNNQKSFAMSCSSLNQIDKQILNKNITYARLALDIYHRNKSDIRKKLIHSYWELLHYFNNNKSGFTAGIYKHEQTGRIVVSFGGTGAGDNFKNDVITDSKIMAINSEEPLQYSDTRKLLDFVNIHHKNYDITGHSLGGSLAQYGTLYTGHSSVTFNAAPVTINKKSLSQLPALYRLSERKISNIRTYDDPLSWLIRVTTKIESGISINDELDLLLPGKAKKDYTVLIDYLKSKKLVYLAEKIESTHLKQKIREGTIEKLNEDINSLIKFVKKRVYGIPDDISLSSITYGMDIMLSLGGGHSISNIFQQALLSTNLSQP